MEDNFFWFITGLIVLIVVFIVLRSYFLWYFKINKRVDHLEKIRLYLWFIAKSQNSIEFERFEEEMENKSFFKTPLQQDIERLKEEYQKK